MSLKMSPVKPVFKGHFTGASQRPQHRLVLAARRGPRNTDRQPLAMHIITAAVRQKIEDHGLSIEEIETVLGVPEQKVPGHSGRLVYQSRVGRFLIRVVVEPDTDPLEVVTAYRTRNVAKYWQANDAD
jgi:hypothetical protein